MELINELRRCEYLSALLERPSEKIMKNSLGINNYLAKATDPRLLQSTPLFLFISLTSFIHVISSIDLEFSDFEIRIPLTIISVIPAIGLIFITHKINFKNLNTRIFSIIAAYSIGGFLRGLILEFGLFWLDVLPAGANNFRIYSGITIIAFSAGIVSYTWASLDDVQKDIQNLNVETLSLKQVSDNLALEIEEKDFKNSLDSFLEITQKLSILFENSTTIEKTQLENLVNKVVRPLSREYAPTGILKKTNPLPDAKLTLSAIWRLFDPVRHIPSSGYLSVILAISASLPVFSLYGFRKGLEVALVVVIALALSLVLILPLLKSQLGKFSSPWREVFLTLGFVAIAIPPAFGTTFVLSDTPNPDAYLLPGLIAVPVYGWIITVGRAAWQYSLRVKEQLQNTQEQLYWSIARINLLAWYKKGLIARLLHGPIQNSLQAAIMQIQAKDDARDEQVIKQVIERISTAIEDSTNPNRSTKDDLDALNIALEVWRSLADVSLDLSEESKKVLRQDPAGCAIFADTVIEACSNAIRHGSSSFVSVKGQPIDAGIEIVIIDDGSRDNTISSTGLGSEFLSACTTKFSRTRKGGQNQLVLELPLGNQPPNLRKNDLLTSNNF